MMTTNAEAAHTRCAWRSTGHYFNQTS